MTMNISEFERTKPRKTYCKIQDAISKYERLLEGKSEVMDLKDATLVDTYTSILSDLRSIKKSFVSGE